MRESSLDDPIPEAPPSESTGVVPSGYYEAEFLGVEKEIRHGMYHDAARFDFEIVEGEHASRMVSCTIDAAESGPVYQPHSLWIALREIVAASWPLKFTGRRCTIYVMETRIGTNRVDAVMWKCCD
jgi:hypothetical protein